VRPMASITEKHSFRLSETESEQLDYLTQLLDNKSKSETVRAAINSLYKLQNTDFKSVERELGSLEGIVGIAPSNDEEGVLGVRLTCKSSADIRGEIYRRIKRTDWILLEFHQETGSLENIFRRLTQEN